MFWDRSTCGRVKLYLHYCNCFYNCSKQRYKSTAKLSDITSWFSIKRFHIARFGFTFWQNKKRTRKLHVVVIKIFGNTWGMLHDTVRPLFMTCCIFSASQRLLLYFTFANFLHFQHVFVWTFCYHICLSVVFSHCVLYHHYFFFIVWTLPRVSS